MINFELSHLEFEHIMCFVINKNMSRFDVNI